MHPAAVSDALLRWASGRRWLDRSAAPDTARSTVSAHPDVLALFLRAACALARVAPTPEIRDRQLSYAQELRDQLRSQAEIDMTCGHQCWKIHTDR